MSRTRVANALLLLSVAVLILAEFVPYHDLYTITLLLLAAGLFLQGRSWKARGIGALFVFAGLYWSSLEADGCSAWWRGRFVADKLLGRLPYSTWDQVREAAFTNSQCDGGQSLADRIVLLASDEVNGVPWEQYRTDLGDFWIAEHGKDSLSWLTWEINEYETYRGEQETIRKGDLVIDAGAHVGVYTRYALRKGAARVIAIEPAPENTACFERNFVEEIANGKVTLIKAGVWNEESTLKLALHSVFTTRPTLFSHPEGTSGWIDVPVMPLDDIVDDLGLERVDVIKMDIEGAERVALEGARRTIRRFRPRMAICTYHQIDDPGAVPERVLAIRSDYQVSTKGLDVAWGESHPKVMLFN